MHTIILLVLSLLLMSVSFAMADAGSSKVSNARFARLARGVNISHWYAQSSRGYGEEHLSTYFTLDDARLVSEMGFTHVRLTLNNQVLFDADKTGELKSEPLARFDERVKWFVDLGLAVVVDLHPEDSYKKLLAEPKNADAFLRNWVALARHLAQTTDPEWVFIEILNEPHTFDDTAWPDLQGQVLHAIRHVAPHHTVIVTGGSWGGMDNLLKLQSYDDRNVVYTFHWYLPFIFTHQAASWGWHVTRPVENLGWPIAPEQADEVASMVTTSEESARHVRGQIARGEFQREWLSQQFDRLQEWAAVHGHPRIYVGEFGVYKKASPRDARLQWYQACREEFEKRGWGWAIWDYAGGFSVVRQEKLRRVPDEQMVEALGLKQD